MKLRCRNIFFVLLVIIGNRVHAALPDWPHLYDTSTVPALNVQLREADWKAILADETFDVEVPAFFWADQDGVESAILVSIRRKSATPINGKVSFKIDINEYEDDDPRAQGLWHGVKKLSLENGDDVDIVSEGIAWAMHRLAVKQGIYPVLQQACALDQTLFWTATDLENKLRDYKGYYNQHRCHSSREGVTPVGPGSAEIVDINNYRWKNHCRGLFQLPVAA